MTILEAINTAIYQLDGVRLPVRDEENGNRIRSVLMILEALKQTVETQCEQKADNKGGGDSE